MNLGIIDIKDVAERHLCCGCGVCAYVAPGSIRMVDTLEPGRRPVCSDRGADPARAAEAMAVCPGVELSHSFDRGDPALIGELTAAWGPVRQLWEGFAADPEIRFAGSSGGAATALALYCMDHAGMHGTLHIAARPDVPYLNHTVLSTTRGELLAATGSRYAPASPCEGLALVENAPAPCVFIGKPCDVAGASKAAGLRPKLAAKLGLTIGIFCAGTPSTRGTLEMLRAMGVEDPSRLTSLRYRGNGWPGKAVATFRLPDGAEQRRELTYEQSWGDILEKHRQWRCAVCADHSGEFADIAVGDPWYRTLGPNEAGHSLILARTERGQRILAGAIEARYLDLKPAEPRLLPASQPGFPVVRGSLWGRLLTCRLLGVAVPRYRGLPMFRFWLSALSIKRKLQSFYGTVKRVFRRRLRHRTPVRAFEPAQTDAANARTIAEGAVA
jgi:coenzyme F420 hydrogenase subunit beta